MRQVRTRNMISGRRNFSRGEFLKTSATGLAGLALFGVAPPAFAETAVPAGTLGVSPDNTAGRNRQKLVEALSYSKKNVTFPAGDYLIDNSGSYINIQKFDGVMTMEPGARFVFTDKRMRGFNFNDCKGTRFHGLRTAFQELPDRRMTTPAQECIVFHYAADTLVEDAEIDGSASGGLVFFRCVRPSVNRATIKNTMADGLHFANCQSPEARNIFTENTGDDGLAFVNYGDGPDHSGGYASNITVRNSKSNGIAVHGQSDVTIEGFTIEGTAVCGLYCEGDNSYWKTRTPSNVRFADGTVHNAGKVVGQSGGRVGIYYQNVRSVEFEDIKVTSPATRGVSGVTKDGDARLTNVEVKDSPGEGFALVGGTHYLNELTARNTGGRGIYVGDCESLDYGKLTSINASTNDSLRRAFNFERNKRVRGKELHTVDDQSNPTGYKITTYGNQSGSLGEIHDKVAHGSCEIENHSGLTIKAESPEPPTKRQKRRRPKSSRRRVRRRKLRMRRRRREQRR